MRLPLFLLIAAALTAAEPPQAELANPALRLKLYLPDATNGFYRATRFDWSGMVSSLEFAGHRFYGPWFQRTDPKVRDFVYQGDDIVAGPCTAATGPAEEFTEIGFADAKPGETFLKIGVGLLRRPDEAAYDRFHVYEITDPGKWSVRTTRTSVEFTQTLTDPRTGYSYEYRKTIKLAAAGPEMTIQHSLRNTGARPIASRVYNHNFLTLDNQPPGPEIAVSVPFAIASARPPDATLAEIRNNQILFRRTLQAQERVVTEMNGFGPSPSDYDIRVLNSKSGAGVRITADRPLARLMLWSIRAVLAVEPFTDVDIQPGSTFRWTLSYHFLKPTN